MYKGDKRATVSRELDKKGLRDTIAERSLERLLDRFNKVRPEIAARFESSRLGRKKCCLVPQCCPVGTNCTDQTTSRIVATVNTILNEDVGCTERRVSDMWSTMRLVVSRCCCLGGRGRREAQRSDCKWAEQI